MSERGAAGVPRGWVPTVWAPGAQDVQVVTDAAREPMRPGADGWWSAVTPLAPGTDYEFSVDGGPPRPDPRSAWQPVGVHGPSRVFDATAHRWADTEWPGTPVLGRVLYELHVGTFTPEGTLAAAIAHLDHLVELGVDLVELMPVAPFDGAHGWGYDGVGLFAVHEPYGGPAALQDFVDAAHVRGLGVVLDVVHNHLGPSGNYLSTFGPYFTSEHQTPWGDAVNLDGPGSTQVRRWICDSALRWFRDFHIDALRLDAVHALADDSARHLLAQLADEVAALADELGRPLSLVAESDLNDAAMVTPTRAGGRGMTAQWADDVHHAIHALVTGERHGYYVDFGTPEALGVALTQVFVHAGSWSTFRGVPWGRPVPPDTDGHRFVVCASNHDQVGNRAQGDRPSADLDEGGLAIEAALVLLSPFTPLLFMGEEWGARTPWQFFTDFADPDLGAAVSAGRLAEFGAHGGPEQGGGTEGDAAGWGAGAWGADGWGADGWGAGGAGVPDPQDPATLERSRLDWSEREQPRGQRLLDWYRAVIALRRAVPALASGDLRATTVQIGAVQNGAVQTGAVQTGAVQTDAVEFGTQGLGSASTPDGPTPWQGSVVVGRGEARVVVNLAHSPATVPVRSERDLQVVLAWSEATLTPRAGATPATLTLPARSVAVLLPV